MPDVDVLEAPITPAPAKVEAPAAEPPVAPAAKDAPPAADRAAPAAKDAPVKPAAAKADESNDESDLDFEEEIDGDAKPQATWPEDWREKLAGTDEKWLKELKRFTSPETFAKSQRSLRQKLSSGEYKRASLPENATEEEKAEWRKENGIPDKPEDYGMPEVKGFEWGEADKPIVGDFLKTLHDAGTPKPIAEQALRWYAGFQQQQAEARAELDRANVMAREDALRAEWGPGDYRPHVNLAREIFQDDNFFTPDLRSALAEARTAGGMRLIHHPDFVRFLAQQGLERRGTAGLISGEQGARLGSRLDEIRKIRDTDIDKYYADGLDKEYLELSEKMEGGRTR